MERVGVFGGTFDPPHVGHLILAEWTRERLHLDRVLFVPAGAPPHKRGRRLSSGAARLAMTRLARRGHPAFEVSTLELGRPEPSYTVDTLRRLHAECPRRRWFLLVGSDSLEEFPTWREPREIVKLATLVVARRAPGEVSATAPDWLARRLTWLDNPLIEISSTMIRARARAARSIRGLVPDSVARYVARHRLYRRAG